MEGGAGRINPALTPCSCTSEKYKGRRANEEDCRRVFTTSRGQVRMAPAVPPHLGRKSQESRVSKHYFYSATGSSIDDPLNPPLCFHSLSALACIIQGLLF